jgi:hypothetical protein
VIRSAYERAATVSTLLVFGFGSFPGDVAVLDSAAVDASDANDAGDANDASDAAVDAKDAAPPLFAVSGTVDGLEGTTVVLLNAGTDPIVVTGDGPFSFPRDLADGAAYVVTVLVTPPGHVCSVVNQFGRIAGADVTNVAVHCPSTNAKLSVLTISTGAISPTFAPATLAYTASAIIPALLSTGAPPTITATAQSPSARITVAGVTTVSG